MVQSKVLNLFSDPCTDCLLCMDLLSAKYRFMNYLNHLNFQLCSSQTNRPGILGSGQKILLEISLTPETTTKKSVINWEATLLFATPTPSSLGQENGYTLYACVRYQGIFCEFKIINQHVVILNFKHKAKLCPDLSKNVKISSFLGNQQ